MTDERRYTEDEVAEILERATTDAPADAGGPGRDASPHGLTLPELQEIGREVGIAEDAISRAAAGLSRAPAAPSPTRRFLGSTIGVGRVIELPRRLSDDEWSHLVVDLRETFDAKGKIHTEGAFRQWTNGNLQALLEPTERGERLRLRTVKGTAYPALGWGAALLGGASIAWLAAIVTNSLDPAIVMMTGLGAVLFGGAKIGLPRWARTRERQMEEIIERLERTVRAPEALPPSKDL